MPNVNNKIRRYDTSTYLFFFLLSDVTPPQVICPANINIATDPDKDSAQVSWNIPVALDNSGFRPTVSVLPALVPPAALPIGNTTVYYIAEDSSKNKAKCSFSVTVKGKRVLIFHCAKKATIHQVTTMLATSKNVLFPGHNQLLTTGTDSTL